MTNPEPRETQGDAPEASPNGNQLQSWPMKILMYLFVAPIVIAWESTKGLFTRTYQNSETKDANFLNVIIGVILSLVAGIGIGYNMGWVSDPPASLVTWLSTAVGATAAVFIYGWTLLHFLVFRHAFKVSEKLWKHVNLDATEKYRRSGDTSPNNPSWFSVLLMAAAWIGVAASHGDRLLAGDQLRSGTPGRLELARQHRWHRRHRGCRHRGDCHPRLHRQRKWRLCVLPAPHSGRHLLVEVGVRQRTLYGSVQQSHRFRLG